MKSNDTQAYRRLRLSLVQALVDFDATEIGPAARERLTEALKRAERVRVDTETFGGQKQGS